MENENLELNEVIETKPSLLHTVTPLSKYLAMALFIALPFLGGWIGYTYAPEKIVEVERIVIVEKEAPTNTGVSQNETTGLSTGSEEKSTQNILKEHFPTLANVNTGDTIGAFTVNTIEVDTFTPFFGGPNGELYTLEEGRHTVLVSLSGNTSLSGNVFIETSLSEEGKTADTAFYIAFKPTSSELEKLPFIEGLTSQNSHSSIIVEGLENHPFILDTLNSNGCNLNDWCPALAPTGNGGPAISDELKITITGFKLYQQTWSSSLPSFPVTTLVE